MCACVWQCRLFQWTTKLRNHAQAQAVCLVSRGFRFWPWLSSHVRSANAQACSQWHCKYWYYKAKLEQIVKIIFLQGMCTNQTQAKVCAPIAPKLRCVNQSDTTWGVCTNQMQAFDPVSYLFQWGAVRREIDYPAHLIKTILENLSTIQCVCACVSDSAGISNGLSSNMITHKLELFAWLREVSGFGRACSPMFALQMHKHVVSGIASTDIAK